MPLYQRINISESTSIIIWKIEESEEVLMSGVEMHPSDNERFERFSNPKKRNEFLALRQCLIEYFGKNPPVHYNEDGKPFLKNGYHISFSHTDGFAGMIVCSKNPVGIDLELFRDRIKRIAHKFIRTEEKESIQKETEVPHLTLYWGAKEVMVKITGNRRLNFINELAVNPFPYQPDCKTSGTIQTSDYQKKISLFFKSIDSLHITYGWEILA